MRRSTRGATTAVPAATVRIASSELVGPGGLQQEPAGTGPQRREREVVDVERGEHQHARAPGARRRCAAVASMPSMPGMRMSMSDDVRRERGDLLERDPAVGGLADHLEVRLGLDDQPEARRAAAPGRPRAAPRRHRRASPSSSGPRQHRVAPATPAAPAAARPRRAHRAAPRARASRRCPRPVPPPRPGPRATGVDDVDLDGRRGAPHRDLAPTAHPGRAAARWSAPRRRSAAPRGAPTCPAGARCPGPSPSRAARRRRTARRRSAGPPPSAPRGRSVPSAARAQRTQDALHVGQRRPAGARDLPHARRGTGRVRARTRRRRRRPARP